MGKKIGVISLGCPKNLVDSEVMLGLLKKKDYEITVHQDDADILIVNTCGFIESAKQESINTILEMARFKEEKCSLLIVTGCMAERYKKQIIDEIPQVDAVVGTGGYGEIAGIIDDAFRAGREAGTKPVLTGRLDELDYLRNERMVSTTKGYAYLKIAEGCDNRCTYCIIPSLRGRYRSRKIEEILEEAKGLVKSGARELILVAQDTTRYGLDLSGDRLLVKLIRGLSALKGLDWIRLLYCYPEEITHELIEEMASNPKVCKYLDIPMQHASDGVLKAMGRRGTQAENLALIKKLRDKMPDIIIRTTFITGFPGETAEDHEILKKFIEECQFDRLGVFTYSREEDTPAAKMKGQVGKREKEKRRKEILELQSRTVELKNNCRVGMDYQVLVQGVAEDGIFYFGRSYAEAPDIDGLIYFTSIEPLEIGVMVPVKILNTDEVDLIGEAKYESTK